MLLNGASGLVNGFGPTRNLVEGLFTRASRDQTNLLTRPECEVDYVAEAKGSCRKAAGVTAWWLS